MNPVISARDSNDLVLRPAGTLCLRHSEKVKAAADILGYPQLDLLSELTVAPAGDE